jgi:5'(3')-deoxyribonucleotidase
MSGAPAALRRLSSEGIRIITHRLYIKYFHHVAVQQTIKWLDHHDIPYWDLCFMRDKAAVGADLYIEDSPENIRKLQADGHMTIVFSNSTIRDFDLGTLRADTWEQVVSLVLDEYDKWKARHEAQGALPGR